MSGEWIIILDADATDGVSDEARMLKAEIKRRQDSGMLLPERMIIMGGVPGRQLHKEMRGTPGIDAISPGYVFRRIGRCSTYLIPSLERPTWVVDIDPHPARNAGVQRTAQAILRRYSKATIKPGRIIVTGPKHHAEVLHDYLMGSGLPAEVRAVVAAGDAVITEIDGAKLDATGPSITFA